MKRWLVTGGVGFIGYHMTRALCLRGDAVTVLDDFSNAPYPALCKRRNEADLRAEFPTLNIVRGNVTDRATTRAAYDGKDGVIHLAALAGVRPSFIDPERYAHVNIEGTATALELSVAAGVRQFLFASSSSVYGNSTPLPAHEDAPAVVPASPYAATKRSAELLAAAIGSRTPDLACTTFRFFTVYGPRQRPEMAIPLFMRAVLAQKPITIFGDGSMRRDFTHVDDIVRGVLLSADQPHRGNRTYNLGSGSPVNLKTLVEMIGHAAGIPPIVVNRPVQHGDVEATFADISRAKADLAWIPSIALKNGLHNVLTWMKENPEP